MTRQALLLTALLLGLSGPASAQQEPSPELEPVRLQLKWRHQFQFAGFYAALERGTYRAAGLDVTLIEGASGVDFIEEVVSGRAQYGVEMPDLLLRRAGGEPVVVLASIFQHSPIALLTLASSGIRTPRDLLGRRVMLRQASNADLKAMVIQEGVRLDQLELLEHSFDFEDLIAGRTDAISHYLTESVGEFELREIAVRTLRPDSYGIDFYGDCLFTSERELREHPKRVEAFRRASMEGWQYAMEHPEELARLIRQRYAPHKTLEALQSEAKAMQPLILQRVVEIGHINPARWQHIADTYAGLGMLQPDYSLEGFLYQPPESPDDHIWYVLAGVLAGVLVVGSIAWIWNHQLRLAVLRRTRDLRESTQKHERLVGNLVGSFLYRYDTAGVFTYVSSSVTHVLGYAPQEFLTHFSEYLTDHPVNERVRARTELSLQGVQQPLHEVQVRHRDGSIQWLEVSEVPVRDEGGRVLAVEGIAHRISERKQAEQERRNLEAQLQQSQKLESLGVLASGIAHDFNNLLVGIYGNMDLALLDLEEDAPVRGYIADARTASRRAADLIGQMLAYAGKAKTITEEIDLNTLVQEMAGLLEASISKKATIRFDPGEDLLSMRGDPTQIRQIVMNLITNAAEALGEETGEIVLKTERIECESAFLNELRPDQALPEGSYLQLRVADTGGGMSAETQARIFDPFFTTKVTGSGLGLSAVHGIVRSHGGAIKVESELGKGTSFTVLFPAVPRSAGASEAKPAPEEWRGSGTILVVDDEDMVRSFATTALKRIGLSVLTASDGAQGVEVFREHADEIDCVLLDLRMPRMDGQQAFEELRRIRGDLPVILCSGFARQESTRQFADKGLAGFIQKPYSLAKLTETLREVLGNGAGS